MRARAVTIGRDAAAIERVVEAAGVPFERCATLEAAVRAAFARAQPGDAVLLSPACASLDMFRNYGAPRRRVRRADRGARRRVARRERGMSCASRSSAPFAPSRHAHAAEARR